MVSYRNKDQLTAANTKALCSVKSSMNRTFQKGEHTGFTIVAPISERNSKEGMIFDPTPNIIISEGA